MYIKHERVYPFKNIYAYWYLCLIITWGNYKMLEYHQRLLDVPAMLEIQHDPLSSSWQHGLLTYVSMVATFALAEYSCTM